MAISIGINASSLSCVKGGASFYIINIIASLSKIDAQNKYIVYCSQTGASSIPALPENFRLSPVAPKRVSTRLAWEQAILPYYCMRDKVDVLLSPNYTMPFIWSRSKNVVVIHDLSFFLLHRLYPRSRRLFVPIIKLAVRKANGVIAVSENTKKDISKYVGDFEEKVSVTYLAADERVDYEYDVKTAESVFQKFGLKHPYILFVGFLEPRKNLQRLLHAFKRIKDKIDHCLVIVGGEGWWYEKTYALVKDYGLENRVIFTGYVENEELFYLYKGAEIFAFPSLYEGFGIAPLEAINCGTPVLASDNTSLPEVTGDAAVYVDPHDTDDIAEKLLDVLTSPGKMKTLRANCERQRQKFDWNVTAQKTLEILRDVL